MSFMIDRTCQKAAFLLGTALMLGTGPVSYTHLGGTYDNTQFQVEMRYHLSQEDACLLYTSRCV